MVLHLNITHLKSILLLIYTLRNVCRDSQTYTHNYNEHKMTYLQMTTNTHSCNSLSLSLSPTCKRFQPRSQAQLNSDMFAAVHTTTVQCPSLCLSVCLSLSLSLSL